MSDTQAAPDEAATEQPAPQIQTVPPSPVPMSWRVGGVPGEHGTVVILEISSPTGVSTYFLPRDFALQQASAMRKAAQTGPSIVPARPKLIVPGGG